MSNIKISRKRNKTITVRCTENEFNKIEEKAKISKLSKQSYILKMSLEGNIILQDLSALNKLSFEINKIGTNINQIVKKINVTQSIYKTDIEIIKKCINEVHKEIRRFLIDNMK